MLKMSREAIKAKRHRLLWVLLAIMVLVEMLIIGGMRYWATPVSYTHLHITAISGFTVPKKACDEEVALP